MSINGNIERLENLFCIWNAMMVKIIINGSSPRELISYDIYHSDAVGDVLCFETSDCVDTNVLLDNVKEIDFRQKDGIIFDIGFRMKNGCVLHIESAR